MKLSPDEVNYALTEYLAACEDEEIAARAGTQQAEPVFPELRRPSNQEQT